jgi:hypothetical protein
MARNFDPNGSQRYSYLLIRSASIRVLTVPGRGKNCRIFPARHLKRPEAAFSGWQSAVKGFVYHNADMVGFCSHRNKVQFT